MNKYISVSQYAEIKGISKQAVYKQLNGKLKEFLIVVDKQKFIDLKALNEVEKERLNNIEQPVEQQLNNSFQLFFEKQLEEKDKQIESLLNQIDTLHEQNTTLTELLKNSQLLLAVEKKVMLEEPIENQKEKKKSLFSRLKRKGD
jgi:adenylate kinase family enzyme